MTPDQAASTTDALADGGYTMTFDVPTEPASPAAARRIARGMFGDWGLDLADPAVDSAVIILSELVTNTVRHTRVLCKQSKVTLSVIAQRLVVAVHDRHPLRPAALLSPHSDNSGGWGLQLVRDLAGESDGTVSMLADRDGGGKTIRVELSLAPRLLG